MMKRDLDLMHRNTVGDLLRKNARKFRDKTAVTCFGERVTFAEFNALANRFAHGLRDLGLQKGDCAASQCRNA